MVVVENAEKAWIASKIGFAGCDCDYGEASGWRGDMAA
jgi:hypothetical protein